MGRAAQFCTCCGAHLRWPASHTEGGARPPDDALERDAGAPPTDVHARPTAEMPMARLERRSAGPGPRPEDFADPAHVPGPAIVGSVHRDTDQMPRTPRLSEPSIIVNQHHQPQGETLMSNDEIKDDLRHDGPSHTDPHFVHAHGDDAYEDEYEDDYYDDEYDDDDEAPLVAVDHDAVSDPGHTFRVADAATPDRSRELQSILAQLQDDAPATPGQTITDREAETNPQTTRARAGKGRKGRGSYPSFEDDQGFQLGDASFIEKDAEIEFFMSDDDSGPVPLTTDEFVRNTNPGLEKVARARPRGRSLPKAGAGFASVAASVRERMGDVLGRAAELRARLGAAGARRRVQGAAPQRRQMVIGLIVVLAVFGLGYAIFAGNGGEATGGDADVNSAAAIVPIDSAGPEGAEPRYELVRLGTDSEAEPLNHDAAAGLAAAAQPTGHDASPLAPVPRGEAVDKKFEAQNVLVPSAVPASPQVHKLNRACILRKGPASRFALLSPLNPGDTLTVLGTSNEDWEAVTVGGLTGWTKGCQGPDCTLRMGPGEQFRVAHAGDDTPKPTGRVISSARWRYVKFGDKYGWTGPACFK